MENQIVVAEETQIEESRPKEKRPDINADESGLLKGQSLEEMWRIATVLSKSGMLPKQFNNNPGAVLAAMQMAVERGLPPLSVIQNTANVNGRTTHFGDLSLGMVYRSGLIEFIYEYWLTEDGQKIEPTEFKKKAFAAVCEVKRKNSTTVVRVFSLDNAKRAGLDSPPWRQYPERMLQMRARTWAIRDAFADITAGIGAAEYDEFNPTAQGDKKESDMVQELKRLTNEETQQSGNA